MKEIRKELMGAIINPRRIKEIFVSRGRKDNLKAGCGQLGSEAFSGNIICEHGAVFEMDDYEE